MDVPRGIARRLYDQFKRDTPESRHASCTQTELTTTRWKRKLVVMMALLCTALLVSLIILPHYKTDRLVGIVGKILGDSEVHDRCTSRNLSRGCSDPGRESTHDPQVFRGPGTHSE
jgi:hypothetical protein